MNESHTDPPEPTANSQERAPEEKTKKQGETKKRSPWERILTWSLIAGLLFWVFVEWQSRNGYNRTRSAIQEQIGPKGEEEAITLSDAEALVEGYAFRSEQESEKEKFVRYRWPSLFKQYVIELELGIDDLVLSFETNPGENDE